MLKLHGSCLGNGQGNATINQLHGHGNDKGRQTELCHKESGKSTAGTTQKQRYDQCDKHTLSALEHHHKDASGQRKNRTKRNVQLTNQQNKGKAQSSNTGAGCGVSNGVNVIRLGEPCEHVAHVKEQNDRQQRNSVLRNGNLAYTQGFFAEDFHLRFL